MTDMLPGRWWHMLDDGRMQCDLCPRDCRLHEGQRGACFVRQRVGDRMVLTTYGRSSGFCIDPVEKKPLNQFYPGSSILSFGTAGCNLACKFCQNWDISKSRDMDRLADQATPEAIAAAALQHGCKSVAFTYNDPVIFAEYAMDIADACRERGVKTVAVTAGYMHAEPRREFYAKMDAANVDLKGVHRRVLLQAVRRAAASRCSTRSSYLKHETRRLVRDHDAAHPRQERQRRGDHRRVQVDHEGARARRAGAFHRVPSGLQDDRHRRHARRDAHARAQHRAGRRPATTSTPATCTTPEGGTTYCPGCRKPLIVRDWYRIEDYGVTPEGACPHCATPLPGRFETFRKQFGRRRIPLFCTAQSSARQRTFAPLAGDRLAPTNRRLRLHHESTACCSSPCPPPGTANTPSACTAPATRSPSRRSPRARVRCSSSPRTRGTRSACSRRSPGSIRS